MSASVLYGCPPLVVNFQDLSTGGPTTYFWDFDGSGTSNIQNPTASFASSGIYNIMHIASNGSSTDTAYLQIRVFVAATVNFTAPDNRGCIFPCHTVHFTNQTIPGESSVVDYVWDFGDGTLPVSAFNTNHCYNATGTYNVTLVALDSNGCQTSLILPNYVVIGNHPTSNASATPVQTCNSPQVVNFTGSGTSTNGAVSYAWYFGNGGTSALQNPTQVYFNGVYDAQLVVTDTLGCQDTAHAQISVTNVMAGFTSSPNNACNGVPVQFTDTSNFANSWDWDFGDGNAHSTQQNPLHTYTTNGTYTITFIAVFNNCRDTVIGQNYITVSTPIGFSLSADDTSSCSAPLTVNFTSNAPGATGYTWDFGDGNTSTSPNPTYTYTTNGTFTVTLGVANSNGCINSQTLSNQVSVGALQADFEIDSTRGCTPLTVHFTNQSTSNVPIISYYWSFGDGTFSNGQNPTHVYNTPGQFTPTLVVQNADGCVDSISYPGTIDVGLSIIPTFTASPLVQCVNQLVTFTDLTQGVPGTAVYLWDFGDGQTSNLVDPDHFYSDTGTYDITLTITNQGCRGDTIKLDYILIVVPKADFYFDFDCANPTTVAFQDSSQGADTWLWEFGDGSTDNVQNPTHTYATQGNYTVTLIVSNILTGCVDSIQKTLPIGTPDANFTADTTNGCYPLTVHFSDTSTFASGWLWSFGDGAFSNQQNPTHTYSDTGRFTVTLMINPGDSCNDSIVRLNYITAYGIRGFISATPNTGCLPLNVAFRDSTSSFLGIVNSWKWYFGNGDSSSVHHPNYTYTTQGSFQAKLIVNDNHGCKATLNKTITPRNIEALFTSDTAVCPGESVHFENTSLSSNQFEWYFGDGTSSILHDPDHTYTSSGSYTVTLIAKNTTFGCSDTLVLPNFMNVDTPIANFFVNSNFSPCPPFPVQFYNTTNRQDLQWLWYFGDGDTSTERAPLHVYFFPGDYDVALVAWDSSGCRDSIIYLDYIRVRGPIGHFTASTDSGCTPLSITITGTTQSTVASVADLGDGTAFTDSINLSHTYISVGTFYPVYTLTDSVGCVVAYPVDTITVGLIPYPNLPSDTTVCRGNYVQFDLTYGDYFDWQANLSPNYLSCSDCRNPICSAPDTITYIVTATTNIGCQAKDTITVNVDALPLIFPGISFRICPNDTLQLSAGPGVASAVWSPNLYITDTTIVNPKVFPPDTQIYRVTGTNSTGCSISRIVKVWLIDKVVADLSLADTLVCDGGDIQFMLNVREASFNDTSFLWSPAAYLNSTIVEDPILSAPVGDYNYTVIVSSSTCIADTETVHVTIAPNPYVEAGDDQTVTEGTQIQLYAASPDNVNYQWFPVEDLSCTTCRRPFLTATQSQHIPVVVTNTFGCKDTAYVDIKVVSCDPTMVFVPNTFTPNNDDLNDVLFVRGIGLRSLDYFRVYDRWGHLVYESKNISEGWDGRINGKEADVATYVYLMKGVCSSGSTIEKSGNVTLVR